MSLSWLKSYLSNRTKQVAINDCNSVKGAVLYGVPQDSILGPLLCLLFISDLPLSLKYSPISEDICRRTTLYSTVSDKTSLETNVQKVLDLVHIWCLEKNILMLIASRQKKK